MAQQILTPTDMANYAYCPRLFHLSRKMADRKSSPSPFMVWGLYEHDVFRILPGLLDTSWRSSPRPEAIVMLGMNDIETALDQAYKLALQNYPQFAVYFETNIPQLRYRLNLWLHYQQQIVRSLIRRGRTFDEAISATLPWKVEDNLHSKKYGLYGRTDAIYNNGKSIIPEDIKTHDGRFSTLIHHESHKTQLVCYSIMAEEKYGIPSEEARIFLSRDLTYVRFRVTEDAKKRVQQQAIQAREQLGRDLPPVLKGPDSVKCAHCYQRDLCFEIDRQQHPPEVDTPEWLDRLLAPNTTDSDIVGDKRL